MHSTRRSLYFPAPAFAGAAGPTSAGPSGFRGRAASQSDGGPAPDDNDSDNESGRDRGRGRGRRGGRGGHGPGFGPGPGRRRAPRGNVRAAVLALLAEEPMHGYAVLGAIAERSGGLWRPSPGSVYPVLGQLQDDGLVTVAESDGRRVFALSEAGRAYVDSHAEDLREPWTAADTRHRDRAVTLFDAVRSLGGAAREVARNGTATQVESARAALDEARRTLYRILADETPADSAQQKADLPAADGGPTD